jgi:cold shock CspA family protein
MDNNIQKGQLKRWDDAKAFGFIKPEDGKSDVFIHISALKGISRRPIVGDTIFFNIQTDKDGKHKAINARIDGVARIQSRPSAKSDKQSNKSNWFLYLLLLTSLSALIYAFIFMRTDPNDIYTCSGKRHCSEMTSCGEAKFYLKNCPGTMIDGDNDGSPCERTLCSW